MILLPREWAYYKPTKAAVNPYPEAKDGKVRASIVYSAKSALGKKRTCKIVTFAYINPKTAKQQEKVINAEKKQHKRQAKRTSPVKKCEKKLKFDLPVAKKKTAQQKLDDAVTRLIAESRAKAAAQATKPATPLQLRRVAHQFIPGLSVKK